MSCLPVTALYFFTQKEVVSDFSTLEEDLQLHQLHDELSLLDSEIQSYKNMIAFVSQLPAVIEILNRGDEIEGSIDMDISYTRYAGVLNRAFEQYENVNSIYFFSDELEMRFALKKDDESGKYERLLDYHPIEEKEELKKILQNDGNGFLITPLLVEHEDNDQSKIGSHLILRLYIPIMLKSEKIGLFSSDIDMGILTSSFPDIHWAMEDGNYISSQGYNDCAIDTMSNLEGLFSESRETVFCDSGDLMAWMPFLSGDEVTLDLWAGKAIHLESVQMAEQKLLISVFRVFVALLILISIIALWISKIISSTSSKFISKMKESILNKKQGFQESKSIIAEYNDLIRNLLVIFGENNRLENEKQKSIEDLQKALDEVKTLQGILPICSYCKKVRNDNGYYEQIEAYIHKHSEVDFSHTICPDCMTNHIDVPKKPPEE